MKPHKELVEIGYRWLKRPKQRNCIPCYGSCSIAFKELSNCVREEPDVIGFRGWCSILIECKATRSDFLSDRKKSFRKNESEGMGQYRFYLTNEGIIKPEEVPVGWGLIIVKERFRGVYVVKDPIEFKEYNLVNERALLCKLLRRISYFDMLDLINDARYKPSVYEWDSDEVAKEPPKPQSQTKFHSD